MRGFTSFDAAQGTLTGMERMPMSKERQRVVEAGAEGRTATKQFYALAASSPHGQRHLPLQHLWSNMCDTTGACGGQQAPRTASGMCYTGAP